MHFAAPQRLEFVYCAVFPILRWHRDFHRRRVILHLGWPKSPSDVPVAPLEVGQDVMFEPHVFATLSMVGERMVGIDDHDFWNHTAHWVQPPESDSDVPYPTMERFTQFKLDVVGPASPELDQEEA